MAKQEAKHIATIEKMEADGWTYEHQALVNVYRPAGSVSSMRPRNGRIYARVHHGKCVGRFSYQVTTVMSKEAI